MSNPTDDTIAVNIAIDIDRHPSFVPCNVFLLAHFCLGRVFVDVLCLSVVVCVLLLLLLSEAHFNVPARISFDSLILSDCCCARTSDNPRQQKMMNGSIDDSVDRLQHPTGRKCRRYSHRYLSLVLLPGRLTRLRPPMINEAKNHPNSAP